MSASAGDFVTPGTHVFTDDNTSLGEGIVSTENGALALLSGKLILEKGLFQSKFLVLLLIYQK
jgi:exosome complex RNA-binding protein Rrp4